VLLAAGAFVGTSRAYLTFASSLPDANALAAERSSEDSFLYADDGKTLLADLHPPGHQHYEESLDNMGPLLPEATIAIEDSNFYHEPGVDLYGIGRAAWIDWREHRTAQGASTITQQLVKLRILQDRSPTFSRKLKEAVLAIQVERAFSKRQILELYLNTVFYGNDAYGTAAAASIYFHTQTKNLTLGQASMLAGIPQNPSFNNPLVNWTGAKTRQRQVLDAMARERLVSPEDADRAYAEDLSPPAHLFRPENRVIYPAFVSYVTDQLKQKYGANTVYSGGLRVTTTLNLGLQDIAQRAVTENVNSLRGAHNLSQGALVSIDPRTGAIVVMVGSANPQDVGGQYNLATVPRNPGSSMKIYNYTAAIESTKFTMTTNISDTPLKITPPGGAPPYEPKNYDLRYHGVCPLQQCLGNSLNVPAVKVELGVGVPAVVDMARRMGAPPLQGHANPRNPALTDYTADDPPDTFGLSLTLGGYGETVLQMATGAAVLGAQGMYHQPFAILRIVGADGAEIFKADPGHGAKQVVDRRVAYVMEQIMSDDSNRAMVFGRGSPLTLASRHVGAKTGTTDNFTDGWTLGYTPSLASAVWMGNADSRPMTQGSDGVYVAAPAWHRFMQEALDALAKPDEWFDEPPGLQHFNVGGRMLWFMPGTNPNQPAPPLPSWAQSSEYRPFVPSPAPSSPPTTNPGNGGGNGQPPGPPQPQPPIYTPPPKNQQA
jgi:membrane peptidoglycan carboxypeptidase